MKILHVSNYLPGCHDKWGGAEQIALRTAKLLKSQNIVISFATSAFAGNGCEEFEIYKVKNIKSYLGGLFGNIFTSLKTYGLFFDIFAYISFINILKKVKPNAVHFHKFEEFSFLLICAARRLEIPVVASIYDYFYFCPLETLDINGTPCRKFSGISCAFCIPSKRFVFLRKLLLLARKSMIKFFLKKIDAFVVLSQSSKNILKSYGIKENKIFTVKQPFLFENYAGKHKKEKSKENIILFVGWIQRRKGAHIIIEVMKKVAEEINDVKLIMVGDTSDKDYTNKIKKLIKDYNLTNNVAILGKLPHAAVRDLIYGAKAVVIPEQWENMSPAVLIEAMYCGKPVVASRIGGIPEFINDNSDGFLIDPKDIDGFAQAIVKILKNEKLAQKISTKARENIEKLFTKEETTGKLIEVYNELVLQ